jgi:Cdc6-like AAA superfamily ATPase
MKLPPMLFILLWRDTMVIQHEIYLKEYKFIIIGTIMAYGQTGAGKTFTMVRICSKLRF